MRKAAGIILIIGAIILIFEYVQLLTTYGFSQHIFIPLLGILPSWMTSVMFVLAFTAALFVISGGIFTLLRKYWRICLTASILSSVFLMLIMVAYAFIGILPLIFICVRKREWQSQLQILT